MNTKIFSFLILLMLAVSCVKQDHNNPFDSQCPKELWTPTDFKATLEGTTVKLTWSQSENRISGFKLTKKVDTGTESALTNQSKDANQLTDASLTGGKVHVYTLVAYAGNNQSNVVTTQITPTFLATVTTVAATSITANSAVLGGSITTDGGAAITERGICWATTANPTTAANKLAIGTGAGTFSNTIPGLLPSTLYYFRAYAINSLGTAYGNGVTETMLSALPTLTTTAVSATTTTTATSGGNITYEGISSVTARGLCWSTTQNPTTAYSKTVDGSGTGSFSSSVTGLIPGTTYYIRAYATNGTGTAYGTEITVLTTISIPTISTSAISAITYSSASSGGNISSDGGSTITAKGICWSTTQNPITVNSKTNDGTGTGTFTSLITGLIPNTTYYVKAYATNSSGTAYGSEVSFTSGLLTDIDGNVYKTVTIGTQVWMAENLKTSKYRNGDPIPNVTDDATWIALTTGAYCWYNNDAANYKPTYGALYNWYAVADNRNIAPLGWHVATDAEWTTLVTFLGGASVAGGKMKEAGTSHWMYPNSNATNSSGFTALPGGGRVRSNNPEVLFLNVGLHGSWWSSTERDATYVWYHDIYYGNDGYARSFYSKIVGGLSIRCVRD